MNCLNSIQHPRPFLGSSFTPPVISNLVQYVTFDNIYNSSGGAWTTGTQYAGNIATSNSPTSLYQAVSGATFEAANKPFANSVYTAKTNTSIFRWNGSGGYVFPQNTGLSFTFWMRMTGLSANYGGPFGIGGESTGNPLVFLALRFVSAGGSLYNINLAIDIGTNSGGIDTSQGGISLNQWYHLAWTISSAAYGASATHRIYKDGSQIYTNTHPYPSNRSRIYNDIGSIPGWGTFAGQVDMFRYYSAELSATQVNDIYTTLDPSVTR